MSTIRPVLHRVVLLTSVLFSFFPFQVTAQKSELQLQEARQKILSDKRVSDVVMSVERSTPSTIVFNIERPAYKSAEAPSALRSYLSLRSGYDDYLRVKKTSITSTLEVPEYQQYFKGVKVQYSSYKALVKTEDIVMLAGSFYEIPTGLSVIPSINENAALEIAKRHIAAKKYAWEEVREIIAKTTNENVKLRLQKELQEYLPKGEVVVVKDFTSAVRSDMRLAYKFNIYASEPLSRGYIYIDAHSGKVLLYDAIIKHASVPTTVTTRYAGNRVIYTKQISGTDPNNGQTLVSSHPTTEVYVPGGNTYVLIDDSRGNGIETYDLNNAGGIPLNVAALYAQGKSFTDVDNNWTVTQHKRGGAEGGAAEAENDDIAWDAHWGAEVVYDYWKSRHNRLSYDGNNANIKNFVHYGPAYDNAFWNGSAMTYGDGSGEQAGGFKALTSLDVCGHEIGHGVTEHTSNLVYEKESGAMNEGFSDIWAACVENFVIKTIDATLATRYKPFFIGEQISYTDVPLRRMDAPKLAGNPDTYGGQNWSNPDCIPNLANDQCGVHNNSGVLNKWFYLLTCGSGNGSGPDAGYVIPGADDGMRDNGTTAPHNDGGTYTVNGLGFTVSEQIAFLTEIMLSSTATFAEARAMSIAAAKAYSGDPCGSIVQSVTNAWYAVGVGAAFTTPCTTTYGFVFQPGITISEGRSGIGCTGSDTLYLPILLPANSTASVTITGTAVNGRDYVASATSFTNNTGSTIQDTLLIAVYNDGVVEAAETINVSISVTNAGANPVNTTYTISVVDDDVVPVIGSDSVVLLNQNFEAVTTGFNLPAGWVETLEIPETGVTAVDPGKNHWGVFNVSAGKSLAVTGRLTSPVPATLPPAQYYNTSTSQTRASTPVIDARGLSDITLKFDYTVQGEVDPNGVDADQFGLFDYMSLTYSFDGVTFREMGREYTFASATPTTGTFNGPLPPFLDNKQFYLGFRWYNDANAGGPVSVSVDNVLMYGLPRRIETVADRGANERINGAQEVYFYSSPQGNIIAKINASGAHNYGCINTSVQRAGNSTSTLYTQNDDVHKVGDKVVRVTPATNNANGIYSISLYFTEEEITAIEDATLTARQQLYIYKTSASTPGGASAANTVKTPATYSAVNGGGIFTATFNTGFSGFAVGAPVARIYPITCVDFKAIRNGNSVYLNWKVSDEQNNRPYEIERSSDGVSFTSIATVNADSRNGGIYQFNDNAPNGLILYYRLKQTDGTGRFNYVCNVQQLRLAGKILSIGNAYPNPVKGTALVKVTSSENRKIQIVLVNNLGQLFNKYMQQVTEGVNSLAIRLNKAPAGTYRIHFKDENGNLLNAQTMIVR